MPGSSGSAATTSTQAGDAEFGARAPAVRATRTVGLSYGREGVMAIADRSVLLATASRGIGQALIEETFNERGDHVGSSHNSPFPDRAGGRIRQCLPRRDRIGGGRS